MSFRQLTCVAVVSIVLLSALAPLPTAVAEDLVYLEEDGIVAIEAESSADLPDQEWAFESDIPGYSGKGYLRAQRTSFNTPGFGVLGYDFLVTHTSDYQFAFSSRIGRGASRSEHNDSWVRLRDKQGQGIAPIPNNNDTRSGQWHKVFMNVNGSWAHNASNRDRDAKSLAWNLVEGTRYELQISSRSEDHLVDRVILWDRDRYNFANKLTGTNPNNAAFHGLQTSRVVPEPDASALLLTCMAGLARRHRSRRRHGCRTRTRSLNAESARSGRLSQPIYHVRTGPSRLDFILLRWLVSRLPPASAEGAKPLLGVCPGVDDPLGDGERSPAVRGSAAYSNATNAIRPDKQRIIASA